MQPASRRDKKKKKKEKEKQKPAANGKRGEHAPRSNRSVFWGLKLPATRRTIDPLEIGLKYSLFALAVPTNRKCKLLISYFFFAVNPLCIALWFDLVSSRNSPRNWPNSVPTKSGRKENVRFSSRRINPGNCCLSMERCVSTAYASILRYPVSRYCYESSSDMDYFFTTRRVFHKHR